MSRLSAFVGAFIVATFVFGATAIAGPSWCAQDPTFVVNGSAIDLTSGWYSTYQPYAKSATFELQVPSNVVAAVLSTPGTVPIYAKVSRVLAPWTGLGKIPVVALVTVSASKSFAFSTQAVGTYCSLSSTYQGKTNKTQKLSFSLLP